jgi:hypothetical protein
MEILRFVRCESFPEGVRLVGCIGDEGNPQGQAVIWEVPETNAQPVARVMTAAEARLVQQRYMKQQIELTELNAKAKRGEGVDEGTVREIMSRDLFAGTSAMVVAEAA